MADIVSLRDIGDLLVPAIASAFDPVTAGGSGNNVAVTGLTVDRMDPATGSLAASGKFNVTWSATLAATFTLSLKNVKVEHSVDGSTWISTPYLTFTDPGVVATGPGGGGTVRGITSFNVDLRSAGRYVRLDWTPVLSAANTDTATLVAAASLAGFDRLAV